MHVFIPFHPKDKQVISRCINSIRKYCRPYPTKITVVCSSLDPDLIAVFQSLSVEVLNENCVPGLFPASQMPILRGGGENRTGWYFQQLVKYALKNVASTGNYLVVDADTILLRPITFVASGKCVLHRMAQHHQPYFETYERLLGYFPKPQKSFIINYLVFNTFMLESLLKLIESRHPGVAWHQAILNSVDPLELASFSEFETYGYYLDSKFPDAFISVDGRHCDSNLDRIGRLPIDRVVALFKGRNSISYHCYRR